MLTIGFFIFALIVIYFSSECLIRHATQLGHALHWPEVLVGFLIIGLGTSVPEIAVSIYAALAKHPDMVVSNIIGSNIANCMLIWGITLTIITAALKPVARSMEVFLVILTLLTVFGLLYGSFGRWLCLIMLLLGVLAVISSLKMPKVTPRPEKVVQTERSKTRLMIYVLIALIGVVLSAKWVIDSGLLICDWFGIAKGPFALVFVALGTSLPEFVLTCIAIRKNYSGQVVGNLFGSNIANLAFGLGVSGFIYPLTVKMSAIDFDSAVFLLSTLVFLISVKLYQLHKAWLGWVLLVFYVCFCVWVI